ncbi:hypothetical protein MBLNU230_g4373t1 [Neophaeotheca triangularis]
MPSYYFHLKLELYPAPLKPSSKHHPVAELPRKAPYLPSRETDVFETELPAHQTSQWSSYHFNKKRPATPGTPSTTASSGTSASPLRSQTTGEPHLDAFLLPEKSANLRDQPESPALVPARLSNEKTSRDWRYGPISIESIDMMASPSASKAAAGKNTASGLHTKAVYLPSDPKTTEVGWGVVRLYRDAEETLEDHDMPRSRKSSEVARSGDQQQAFDPEQCTTVCILAVPSWMMPSDLLGFVGDRAREDVSHFRLIRTDRANKYMVLMKFKSARKAREWQKANNGRLFSAAEPENCHVVFIRSVEFLTPDTETDDVSSFPQNTNDPFTPSTMSTKALGSKALSNKPYAPPPPNLLELPTCPVCLERMDETTGLLTILCQHVFHCACLEKWRGSGCPVCRYTHSPSYTFPYPRPSHSAISAIEPESDPVCAVCTTSSNLWICLICGNIGCGRYDSAHAYAHYEATSHCYAMDISTQHVWDYAGDGYVHRLIQSKPDSSLIDLPARDRHENEAFRAEGGESVPREKMENMANEYTYLLSSQLEGQRRYFEEQVERAVDKAGQAVARAEQAAASAQTAVRELEDANAERDEAKSALERLELSLEKSDRSRAKFEQMARDMSKQLREEKTMNEGLLKRIKAADEQAEAAQSEALKAREEKKDLEEMNHDLTMFISSQEKVKELQAQGEEVVDGSASAPGRPKGKGKGRKK